MDDRIASQLSRADSSLVPLIRRFPSVTLTPSHRYFTDLVNAIICQQLSDKAGATIWRRFELLFPEKQSTPEKVLKRRAEDIRAAGISRAKVCYIQCVAQAFVEKTLNPERFSRMEDEELIEQLMTIKGVGRWTAEMFCIFSLGREDIFSTGDLGLSKALRILHGRTTPYTKIQMERIARHWSPYRSYASLLLWKSLETG